jgi:hypothetical protein
MKNEEFQSRQERKSFNRAFFTTYLLVVLMKKDGKHGTEDENSTQSGFSRGIVCCCGRKKSFRQRGRKRVKDESVGMRLEG